MLRTIDGATITTQTGVVEPRRIRTDGAVIVSVEAGVPKDVSAAHLLEGWLVPGFVDLHCHGGGGGDFASARPTEITRAARFHLHNGTTAMLASLEADHPDILCRQLAVLADVIEQGETQIFGVHLEGPFLSRTFLGSMNLSGVYAPDLAIFHRLLSAGRGWLRMITLAPELSGALELIQAATAAGVVVAVGHTDATYRQAMAAFEHGASVLTHTFNAMRPVHHREPGPVVAALDSGAACEIINDGIHVHPSVARLIAERTGSQLVLVTDAISAAGVGDGRFSLGGQDVVVTDGTARMLGTNTLAGSTLTTGRALKQTVHASGLSLATAVGAASTTPAKAMGIANMGDIADGFVANLVHLNQRLDVSGVMWRGEWLALETPGETQDSGAHGNE